MPNARIVSAARMLDLLADRYPAMILTREQDGTWTFQARPDGDRCTAPTLADLLQTAWYYDLGA